MKSILLTVALAISAPSAVAQTTDPPLITVTGQAEVRATPDEVLFTLSVENVDKDMLVANKRTDDSVKQILAIARQHGVKPDDVQTSQISVQPKYNTDDMEFEARRNVKRVLIGYQVSKTVAVRLRDISRFDEMLADILKAGITRLSNLEFRSSQLRKHRDEARRMAMRAAKEKATLLAGEIGQSIGPAYSITEVTRDYVPRAMQNAVADADEAAETDSALAPGTLSVSAQVTVRFRLN